MFMLWSGQICGAPLKPLNYVKEQMVSGKTGTQKAQSYSYIVSTVLFPSQSRALQVSDMLDDTQTIKQ